MVASWWCTRIFLDVIQDMAAFPMQLEAESSCSHGPSPASADRKCWTASLLHDKASVLRSPGRHSPVRTSGYSFESSCLQTCPNSPLSPQTTHLMAFSPTFNVFLEAMPVFAPDADRPIESSQPENGDSPKRLEKSGKLPWRRLPSKSSGDHGQTVDFGPGFTRSSNCSRRHKRNV